MTGAEALAALRDRRQNDARLGKYRRRAAPAPGNCRNCRKVCASSPK